MTFLSLPSASAWAILFCKTPFPCLRLMARDLVHRAWAIGRGGEEEEEDEQEEQD